MTLALLRGLESAVWVVECRNVPQNVQKQQISADIWNDLSRYSVELLLVSCLFCRSEVNLSEAKHLLWVPRSWPRTPGIRSLGRFRFLRMTGVSRRPAP